MTTYEDLENQKFAVEAHIASTVSRGSIIKLFYYKDFFSKTESFTVQTGTSIKDFSSLYEACKYYDSIRKY